MPSLLEKAFQYLFLFIDYVASVTWIIKLSEVSGYSVLVCYFVLWLTIGLVATAIQYFSKSGPVNLFGNKIERESFLVIFLSGPLGFLVVAICIIQFLSENKNLQVNLLFSKKNNLVKYTDIQEERSKVTGLPIIN